MTTRDYVNDYFGNELRVGDTVAFIETGYRNFMTGIVAKINPKKITIEWQIRHKGLMTDAAKIRTTQRFPEECVKNHIVAPKSRRS